MVKKKTKSGEDFDPVFDGQRAPCYSVKIFKDKNLFQVLENRTILKQFKLSGLLENVDLNDPETLSGMIRIVREEGVDALKKKYKLRAVTK